MDIFPYQCSKFMSELDDAETAKAPGGVTTSHNKNGVWWLFAGFRERTLAKHDQCYH